MRKTVFTTKEIAGFCHVATNTVWRWSEEGKVPFFRTAGGRRRVWLKDVVELLLRLGIPVPEELRPPPSVSSAEDSADQKRR